MHNITRQDIWRTALAELQERRRSITPKSLAECAAKIASALINEIVAWNTHRYLQRHGHNLLRLDQLINDELHQVNPVAWHGYQTTWRRHTDGELAGLIADQLAVILWNRGLDRGRYAWLFGFTADEAKAYCPEQQLSLF